MTPRDRMRGTSLVELLVGTAVALGVLATLTGAIGTGGRLLVTGAARGEGEDIVQLAIEAFTFDVRRSGWDPLAAGVNALQDAHTTGLTLAADLDGNGAIDPASEEVTSYVYAAGAERLSRIIGRQSLPLAEGVVACAFRYLDAAGVSMAVPPAGLDAAMRGRVRAVVLDLTLAPSGLVGVTRRVVAVALRSVR